MADTPTPILLDAPPYRAWCLNPARGWPWGISGAGGWNCWNSGAHFPFLSSRDAAEAAIRGAGHEPGPPRDA